MYSCDVGRKPANEVAGLTPLNTGSLCSVVLSFLPAACSTRIVYLLS